LNQSLVAGYVPTGTVAHAALERRLGLVWLLWVPNSGPEE
jgi:hypothetical protein